MMENSKLVFVILILMSSCGTLRVASDADLSDYLGSMLGGSSMTCMEKILPCQPYVTPGPVPPPANCCTPLKELITNDTKCICDTFNNPLLRGSLNVSIEDIMKLPKACNETFDLGVCNKTGSATTDSTSKGSGSAKTTSMDSTSGSDSSSDSDSPPDSGSSPDSDSKPSGANGNLSSLPGRKSIISLAFFVVFILSVHQS